MKDRIGQKFRQLFHNDPILIASPGRVNLIGEHTDYNEGYVLPAAIDKQIVFALAANGTSRINLHAAAFDQTLDFSTERLGPFGNWADYILGVVAMFNQKGLQIGGFDCVLGGDIPIGAGLSSSAALECGIAFGLNQIFGLNLDRLSLARIGQQAEHQWVGVKCGIMDQFASLLGQKDKVIRLDCRSLEFRYIPFDFPEYRILLCNTLVDHSLATSEYNIRRQQCEEGVRILGGVLPGIQTLRDVSCKALVTHRSLLPSPLYERCSYVVEENDRVVEGSLLLEQGNLVAFGKLMYASHQGLSQKYEVSCPELDFLVQLASGNKEIVGARMMGGGFGGCVIHIIREDAISTYSQLVSAAYREKFSKTPEIYVTSIENGTHQI
ncbi:MAG TPA: galactokinase [Chitinophagaceae bacterium]|nr:galactokinase [Chitinophagaceae bacterium]